MVSTPWSMRARTRISAPERVVVSASIVWWAVIGRARFEGAIKKARGGPGASDRSVLTRIVSPLRSPYEYKDLAHEISRKVSDEACRMLRSRRQAGVKGKKLPPLVVRIFGWQARPGRHLAPHPGHLPLGVAAGLLLGAGDRFGQGRLAADVGREPPH